MKKTIEITGFANLSHMLRLLEYVISLLIPNCQIVFFQRHLYAIFLGFTKLCSCNKDKPCKKDLRLELD